MPKARQPINPAQTQCSAGGWQGNGHNPRAGGTRIVRASQWRASGTQVHRIQLVPRTAYGVNKIACILHAVCIVSVHAYSLHARLAGWRTNSALSANSIK